MCFWQAIFESDGSHDMSAFGSKLVVELMTSATSWSGVSMVLANGVFSATLDVEMGSIIDYKVRLMMQPRFLLSLVL